MKSKFYFLFTNVILLFCFASDLNAQISQPTENQIFSMIYGQTKATVGIQWYAGHPINGYQLLRTDLYGTFQGSSYNDIPHSFQVDAGSHTWQVEVFTNVPGSGYVRILNDYVTFFVQPQIRMDATISDCTLQKNGSNVSSGHTFTPSPGQSTTLGAYDQYKDNYWRRFSQWTGPGTPSTSNLISASAPTSLPERYEADMRYEYNVVVQNNSGGQVKVNGVTYSGSSPSLPVIQYSSISIQALSLYNQNGINFHFHKWSDNNTANPRAFIPSAHGIITAEMKGYATTKNVHFINIIPGQPICLDWDTHDNAGVTQYKVWRYPKYGATTCIATLGSSVTSFTDYDYVYSTGSPEATVLFYSVTAYYSPDQTWGDQVWINTSGETGDPLHKIDVAYADSSETVAPIVQNTNSLYSLNNSPNPFNPTTQIHYSLPETEQVTIKVFNMLGKEVTELVNAVQRKGQHVVTFNADNLSSGVYIYTIQTPHYTASKKMILMK